eukprot:1437655-Pleurochrysis_carterae.AAC.1
MEKFALLSIWDSGNYVKIDGQSGIPRLALLGVNLGVAIGSRQRRRRCEENLFLFELRPHAYGCRQGD